MPRFHPGQDEMRRAIVGVICSRPSDVPSADRPEPGNSPTAKKFEACVRVVSRMVRWNEEKPVAAYLLKALHGRDFPWLASRMNVSTNTAMSWYAQGRRIVAEGVESGRLDRDALRAALAKTLARFD